MNALPPPDAPLPDTYTECIVEASAYYRVPPSIVATLLMVEGGKVGTVSGNDNRTDDLGPMQFNTIHRTKFERLGISQELLTNDACTNIAAGTMLLAEHLARRPNDPWRAVGDYHSQTPKYHQIYMRRVKENYVRLLGSFAAYTAYLRDATMQLARRMASKRTLTMNNTKPRP